MNPEQFKQRTRKLALRIMKLCDAIPSTIAGRAIANQLVRSGTSVGANYRAACRARTKKEMAAKLGYVEEEADESIYWMELLVEAGLIPAADLEPLMTETSEVLAMTVASIRTIKASLRSKRKGKDGS